MHVGETLANAGLRVADDTYIFDLAAFAELLPETLLDVCGDLLLLALLGLDALALVIDEGQVANEYASSVVDRGRMRKPVHVQVAVEQNRAVETLDSFASGDLGCVDGVGVCGFGGRVHELFFGEGRALGERAGESCGTEPDRLNLVRRCVVGKICDEGLEVLLQGLLG